MGRSRGAGCSSPRSRCATRICRRRTLRLLASPRRDSYRSCNASFEGQAMNGSILATATAALEGIGREGLTERERAIVSPQGSHIAVEGMNSGGDVINLCANNYLGLADHPRLIEAAREALSSHGLGMASVRFICGTSDLHRRLEQRLRSEEHTSELQSQFHLVCRL